MALYDSTDLLARCIRLTRVPSGAVFPSSTDWYAWLTDAENEIKADVVSMFPNVWVQEPTLMTTTDGGYTYYFELDASNNPIYPIGSARIYRSLSDIPSTPMVPGLDYAMEGYQIRFPNNVPVNFSQGPWAQYVVPTVAIDATHQSTLPSQFRLALVYKAAAYYGQSGGGSPETYEGLYQQFRMATMLPALATQFRDQGAVAALRRYGRMPFPING